MVPDFKLITEASQNAFLGCRMATNELLTDWGLIARKLQRMPTRNEYKLQGEYSPRTFEHNFGSWSAVPDSFRSFAAGQADWTDITALLPAPESALAPTNGPPSTTDQDQSAVPTRPVGRRPPRLPDRPTYGNPIDFRGLRHAPVNEDGVIFLFGMVARELGYLVESVQVGFPDCEAKRQIGPTEWQRVRVEFEFESRNFRDHGHAQDGCDVIVCWLHNWRECPDHLEVIELKSVITRLAASDE